jgi:hypothetical protein
MLKRAWELKDAVRKFLAHPEIRKEYGSTLMMSEDEWKMVDILLNVLQPFNDVTTGISTNLEPTIHEVFRLYNWLFDEIAKSKEVFPKEPLDPVSIGRLAEAIQAAEEKLKAYYAITDNDRGLFYNLGTILDPLKKAEKSYKVCD